MGLKFLTIFVFTFAIFSQEINQNPPPAKTEPVTEKNQKNARTAALLGIIPGVGQAYIGNYYTGAFQLGLFVSLVNQQNYYTRQPDYIRSDDRTVEFNLEDAVVGYSLQKSGFVYNDLPYRTMLRTNETYQSLEYPIFSETRFERDARLIKEGKLAEESTLVKYGSYTRASRSSFYSDMLGNPILSTMMYSIYSSYRDAGGLGEEKKSETIGELAYSPFNYKILKDPFVFAPIALIIGLSGLTTIYEQDPILVPSSLKKDGSIYASTFVTGLSPGIGEEAFFRGYLNYNLIQNYGTGVGIAGSGFIFMLAHEGNSDARDGRLSRLLSGLYLGFLHYRSNYDIKPGIAVHFWWNFIIGLSMINQYKSDPNYDKSQKEAFYMPIQYTFSF
jgi:membrane protease YdiL (CAAX protease family)